MKTHCPTWLLAIFLLSMFHLEATASTASLDSLLQQASLLHKKGLENDLVNPAIAIDFYKKALAIRKSLHEKHPSLQADPEILEAIIKGYYNIGDCWLHLGNFAKAENYLDSCMMMQLKFEREYNFFSHYRRGQLFHGTGQLYRAIAGFDISLITFQKAITNYGLATDRDPLTIKFESAKVLNDISVLLIKWEMDPDSIIAYANEAHQMYLELLNEQNFNDGGYAIRKEIVSAKINLGFGYYDKGSFDSAEASFRDAKNDMDKLNSLLQEDMHQYPKEERGWHVAEFGGLGKAMDSATSGLGITLTRKGRFAEAEQLFLKGVGTSQWLRKLDPEYDQALVLLTGAYHNLGETYFEQGEFQKALEENQKAITSIVKDFEQFEGQYGNPKINDTKLYIFEDIYFLHAMLGKTKCLRQLQKEEEALATADLAIQYIYQIRRNYEDMPSRFQLANLMKELTEEVVGIYLQKDDPEIDQAFYYVEKSKIFTLLEAVKDHQDLKIAGVNEGDLREEKKLRKEIDYLLQQIAANPAAVRKAELLDSISYKKEALSEVLKVLHNNPNYRRLMVGLDPVSISDIQNGLIENDQILVEYFVGRNRTYVFIVPAVGNASFAEVNIDEKQLTGSVEEFLNSVFYSYQAKNKYKTGYQANWTQQGLEKQLLSSAQRLYEHFFAPVSELVDGSRVVIIPDGALNKLPFSALIRPGAQNILRAYHTYDYLGLHYATSYCYAATLLAEMQKPTQFDQRDILAFAPTFSGNNGSSKYGFSKLRFNENEVEEICAIFSCKSTPFVGENAVKENFLKEIESKPYYLLHLSTHGKADYNDPNNSFISFSQMHEAEIDKGQLFYLRELLNLEMAVEMVVLSSCESSLGPIHRAGGMISLTRGFAFAGAKTIVSSLWQVNEQSTTSLMLLFYEYLNDGLDKDRAMQKARTELRKNSSFKHPYYWASFITVGKTQKDHKDNDLPTGLILLAALGVLSLSFMIKKLFF